MPLSKRKIDYLMFKTQGRIIKVDPDIYNKIFNTQRNPPNRKYNGIITNVRISSDGYPVVVFGKRPVLLSHFVTNAQKGQIVDHKNRDPLDNRRSQLRIVTKRQNNLNKKCNNGTGLFGVFIKHQDKRVYCVGKFMPAGGKEMRFQLPDSPVNRVIAAFARDRFVLQSGEEEYAPLNFPCWRNEPFRSILLQEDLKKYKTARYTDPQLEFVFMKDFKK